MSRNDDRPIGGDDDPFGGEESERLKRPGAGARVTGVHGVGAPEVTDHDIPAAKPEPPDEPVHPPDEPVRDDEG